MVVLGRLYSAGFVSLENSVNHGLNLLSSNFSEGRSSSSGIVRPRFQCQGLFVQQVMGDNMVPGREIDWATANQLVPPGEPTTAAAGREGAGDAMQPQGSAVPADSLWACVIRVVQVVNLIIDL